MDNNNNQSMEMVVLPAAAWKEMTQVIGEVKNYITQKEREEKDEWIESTAARKMLGVSSKTWQIYRDRRIIPFSQFGRKIMVRRSDINSFLERHYMTH